MKPDETQIRAIVNRVWSTQLGLEIQNEPFAPQGDASPTMTAAVHISGDCRGAIRLTCSRAMVRRAAAIMFDLPAEELSEDDELDVIGELTNVVAGNIKALIPGNNSISLPTIIDGTDYRVSTLDIRSSDDFHFALDGEPMTLTILEHVG